MNKCTHEQGKYCRHNLRGKCHYGADESLKQHTRCLYDGYSAISGTSYYDKKEQKNMELVDAWLWAIGIIVLLVIGWRLIVYLWGVL